MTGAQYKRALKAVGLSIRKAGPFLGFTERQSFRIASGEAEIPESARKLLLVMMSQGWTGEHFNDVLMRAAPAAPKS